MLFAEDKTDKLVAVTAVLLVGETFDVLELEVEE